MNAELRHYKCPDMRIRFWVCCHLQEDIYARKQHNRNNRFDERHNYWIAGKKNQFSFSRIWNISEGNHFCDFENFINGFDWLRAKLYLNSSTFWSK